MEKHIGLYWNRRIEKCGEALTQNNFDVFKADKVSDVKGVILDEIFPKIDFKIVSWGDSISMLSTGIIDEIPKLPNVTLIKTFEEGVSRDEILERRRQALLSDVFLTGSNAVTESGKLVNLDMVGNRVGGITFGPKNVIIVVGRSKIVSDVDTAIYRIKSYAAPLNAIRHPGWKTPCVKTAHCTDCKSPQRICNTWTITEKSYPKGRIKVILVNENLGL